MLPGILDASLLKRSLAFLMTDSYYLVFTGPMPLLTFSGIFFFSIPVSLCKVPRLFNTRPTSRLPSGPLLLPPLALLPPTKIV